MARLILKLQAPGGGGASACKVQGLGCGFRGLGFRVEGVGFRGLGFRVEGVGFRGLGFRV